MKKRDFETYQKRFRDFEFLPKFSETHDFRGTIRHPWKGYRESCQFQISSWLDAFLSQNVAQSYA